MDRIYRYNPDTHYQPKIFSTKKIHFNVLDIYLNETDNIKINLKDIFSDYNILFNDKFKLSNDRFYKLNSTHGTTSLHEYFMYYRSQLNFAVYCSTTSLGVSNEHVLKGSNLLKSIYLFHIYYHIRRIFHQLQIYLPHENGYKKYDNNYSKNRYYKICKDYGVNPNTLFINGDWYYSNQGEFADNDIKIVNKYTLRDVNNNYCVWMLDKSNGLTKKALEKLSESVRIYAYLLITSQVSSRKGYKTVDFEYIYKEEFENMINRSDNIERDIKMYQDVLKYSRSPVDFVIAYGVYMCPSNMIVVNNTINNWNNKLLISNNNMKIGHVFINTNKNINESIKKDINHKTIPLIDTTITTNKTNADKITHEEEKAALILGITGIFSFWWFFIR